MGFRKVRVMTGFLTWKVLPIEWSCSCENHDQIRIVRRYSGLMVVRKNHFETEMEYFECSGVSLRDVALWVKSVAIRGNKIIQQHEVRLEEVMKKMNDFTGWDSLIRETIGNQSVGLLPPGAPKTGGIGDTFTLPPKAYVNMTMIPIDYDYVITDSARMYMEEE